ncbi:hypothetical protein NJI34_02265 [Pseudomonas sp. S 311-6]|uniref:hypothetical protein n=1 Tax=Kerstersia gyiorum TaxID=206506 RepID=UPI00209719AC|nr:hypothetical protein [Pseudomonas sp. S 311-6]
MDRKALIVIVMLVIIVVISWYRSGKKTVEDLVTPQDKLTTKGCIQMALQILGSALKPQSSKSPADAITAGERALVDHGMSYAVVVNVLVMGFLGGYIAKNKLNSARTQALLIHASTVLADGLNLSGEDLWARSGELTKVRGPLGFLMQKAAKDGVSLPGEVQEGSVLAGLVIDAVKQAGG